MQSKHGLQESNETEGEREQSGCLEPLMKVGSCVWGKAERERLER